MGEIAVVIPCWNEAENVEMMVRSLDEIAESISEQLVAVFVDDGSSDDTWERICVLSSESTDGSSQRVQVQGIRMLDHSGKGAAQALGLRRSHGARIVVLMDGDGQHPISELPTMIRIALDGNVAVIGTRENYTRGLIPSIGTWALGVMMKVLGVPFDPSLSEYVALPQSVTSSLVRSPQLGVSPIVPLVQACAPSYATFPVEVLPRFNVGEKSRWSFTSLWQKALLQLLADPWRLLPRITILAVVSFLLLAVAAIASGIRAIIEGTSPGTVAILGAVVVLAAITVGMWVASMVIGVVTLRSLQASHQMDAFTTTADSSQVEDSR
jgi:polyisoprenyl-phosphate glycosyltransferase